MPFSIRDMPGYMDITKPMPPDPKLQLYLAQHYYSGPKADIIAAKYGDGRKKKKKKTTDGGALTIRDESETWPTEQDEEDAHVEAPAPATGASGWSAVGVHTTAQVECAAPIPTASAPAPVTDAGAQPPAPRAGLMTREEIRAQREARRAAEQAQREQDSEEPEQETVYRDEQGRRVNVAEEEARIRAEQEAEVAKEKERATWTQGLAQRREREAREAELRELRKEGVTRYVHANERRER